MLKRIRRTGAQTHGWHTLTVAASSADPSSLVGGSIVVGEPARLDEVFSEHGVEGPGSGSPLSLPYFTCQAT